MLGTSGATCGKKEKRKKKEKWQTYLMYFIFLKNGHVVWNMSKSVSIDTESKCLGTKGLLYHRTLADFRNCLLQHLHLNVRSLWFRSHDKASLLWKCKESPDLLCLFVLIFFLDCRFSEMKSQYLLLGCSCNINLIFLLVV